MKILFDVISIQGFINGGAEYVQRILSELIERNRKNCYVEIIGLYDSTLPFVEKYNIIQYLDQNNIHYIDIKKYKSLSQIIQQENIDTFFIGIAQRYLHYDIKNIRCRTIMVMHDVYDYEINDNNLNFIINISSGNIYNKIKIFIKTIFFNKFYKKDYSNLISLYNQQNVYSITVSEHSKGSLFYYFPNQLVNKDIRVLYSPQKLTNIQEYISNRDLSNLILSKKKYYLVVSANRTMKNAQFVIDTFKKICAIKSNIYLVTVGYKNCCFQNHIILPNLTSSDLEHAYKNASSLIFASIEEGFGYPPLEAMKYGTPVISSNVCSMPEILGDSCLFFSPFYKNDLFNKVMQLEENKDYYVKNSFIRSEDVRERQEKDLVTLLNLILNV